MPVFPRLAILLLIGLAAGAATAAELPHRAPSAHHVCLSKAEQRAAVTSHQAISLAEAIKTVRKHRRTPEIVRARLCHHGDGRAYVLTLLAPNGKVTRVAVDAANGELIKGY